MAESNGWRLALVGDPRQLQGVGRGGLLAELCLNGRVDELERLHRFTHRWEARASLQLRAGDPRALDAYEARGRIVAGPLDAHIARMATIWTDHHRRGQSVALVASSNDHVDGINRAVQSIRLDAGHLDPEVATRIAGGEHAHVGDVVATRHNDRRLTTSQRQPVRNRDTWTVTGLAPDGGMTVSHLGGHGEVTLPADYVREHVRLGYAATEHGWQSDTVTNAIALTSSTTTRRGLYVAATRGSDQNVICVVTNGDDVAEARDVLEAVLAVDRADIPAVTQRRTLAEQLRCQPDTISAPPPARCAVPEWFPTLLRDAERDLSDSEAHSAERTTRRTQLSTAATAVDHTLSEISAATFSDRDAYAQAATGYEKACGNHAAVQSRLDLAPRRQRRSLRTEVDIAEQQMERAKRYLDRSRQRTAPSIERHGQAVAKHRDIFEQLRSCDIADQLDALAPSVDEYRRRVVALTTWRRWAEGATVPIKDLRDAFDTFTDGSPQAIGTWQLADSLHRWAADHDLVVGDGVELVTVRHTPELGLER